MFHEKLQVHTQPQRFSITKPESEIQPSDLRPAQTKSAELFQYTYALTESTPLDSLPLELVYRDGDDDVGLGVGWRLVYQFPFRRPAKVSIMSPEITFQPRSSGGELEIGNQLIPVEVAGSDGEVLISRDLAGLHCTFVRADSAANHAVLPQRIDATEDEPAIEFRYHNTSETPRLRSIRVGALRLETVVDAGRKHLANLVLVDEATTPPEVRTWVFSHRISAEGETFLTSISDLRQDGSSDELKFNYEVFERARGIAQPRDIDFFSPNAPRSSAWLRQAARDGRWKLPKAGARQLTIRGNPGLRFVHLNKDDHLDLVNVKDRELDAWVWNPKRNRFDPFGETYRPLRGSIRGQRPTGTHFLSLEKKHVESIFNTGRYQALASSFYQPTANESALDYHNEICFPRVINGQITPDADNNAWACDPDRRLKLPVPLQYEGLAPWPTHLPATRAVETVQNQGAQFVKLTREEGRIDLLYVGLRYTDARTSKTLLGRHRDTGNCRPWHEEVWEHLGKSRRVKVDLCQAFWSSADSKWRDDFQGDAFWLREDLDESGKPTERFILPWQDDQPDYYHHYLGFRNVRFAKLEKRRSYAIVKGVGIDGPVRDVYKLFFKRWIKVAKSDNFFPPDDVMRSQTSLFADLDGDGRDDAVIPRGPFRRTYINRNSNSTREWRPCPAFDIPTEADLVSGSAQWVDLNEDGLLDLIFHDGSAIYLNRGRQRAQPLRSSFMTSFTDRTGELRRVADFH